jgi:hypothetical protein
MCILQPCVPSSRCITIFVSTKDSMVFLPCCLISGVGPFPMSAVFFKWCRLWHMVCVIDCVQWGTCCCLCLYTQQLSTQSCLATCTLSCFLLLSGWSHLYMAHHTFKQLVTCTAHTVMLAGLGFDLAAAVCYRCACIMPCPIVPLGLQQHSSLTAVTTASTGVTAVAS